MLAIARNDACWRSDVAIFVSGGEARRCRACFSCNHP